MESSLRELHELVGMEGVSAQVAESGRGTLYAAVNVICRNGSLGIESPLIQLCRNYAIEGSTDPEPVFDAKYHLPFDSAGWGSPSPRIEALQALGQLIWNYYGDDEIVIAFCKASLDEVPAVRYQVARYLTSLYKRDLKDRFWQTLKAMMEVESTSGVMLALLHSLQTIAGFGTRQDDGGGRGTGPSWAASYRAFRNEPGSRKYSCRTVCGPRVRARQSGFGALHEPRKV